MKVMCITNEDISLTYGKIYEASPCTKRISTNNNFTLIVLNNFNNTLFCTGIEDNTCDTFQTIEYYRESKINEILKL